MNKESIAKVLKILSSKQTKTMLGQMGEKWNPFQVLISTILSARCRDEVTEVIAEKLFKKYPSPKTLAYAKKGDVEKIIHPIGFYHQKTKSIIGTAKIIHESYNDKVPETLEALDSLPGVGRKVANCVLVYSFDKPAIPVDTHVHRISNRLGWVKTKNPEDTEKTLEKIIPKKLWTVVNDSLVHHGKTICLPITPICSQCPIRKYCKRAGVKRSK